MKFQQTTHSDLPHRFLIYGDGYLGRATAREALARGWHVQLVGDGSDAVPHQGEGFDHFDPADEGALNEAVSKARAILVCTPPERDGCPALKALVPVLGSMNAYPDWIGYVSSSAVYGDRAGGWAFEDQPLNAASLEGARYVKAEHDWLDAGRGMGLTIQLFRLPSLYGPGHSLVERVLEGSVQRVIKPGQVFNRIHVHDAVAGFFASMARPRPGAAYSLADDEPAPAEAVLDWTARQMGLSPLPQVSLDDPAVSEAMRRFYNDNKRLSNALAKAELGWHPRYPSWREGLSEIIAQQKGQEA